MGDVLYVSFLLFYIIKIKSVVFFDKICYILLDCDTMSFRRGAMRKVFSILVENTSGVLSRVSGLFSRRGYNISSLTVAETENPGLSRMTVVADGDEPILEQIKQQLLKLEDVIEINELRSRESVCRELMLIKVGADLEHRTSLTTLADIFHAKVVDVSNDSRMMELTGNQDKLDSFIKMLNDYEIKEMVRTGITGLMRADAEDYMDNVASD